MSVKRIPTSEILETPDVNILNDNVLDKVDYRYNQTEFEYQSVFNGNIYLYKFPEPYTGGSKNTTYYFQDVPTSAYQLNVSYYKRNTEYNSQNINKIKQSIPNYGFLIYYYDFVSFQYTDNSVGKEEYKIDWDTVQSGFRTGFDNGDYLIVQYPVTDTTESYNIVYSYQEVLDLWFNLDSNNNIISSKYNSGAPSICVIKNGSIYTIYMLFLSSITNTANTEMYRVDTQFNFSILRNKIKTSSIEIDNNSSFSLQSNELITQNTLYNGIKQISEYISEDIKLNYENGKATIKLTCVYNGENEYSVGDIVIPMKDRFNPVLSDAYGIEKMFEVTSSEISYTGRGKQILELVEVLDAYILNVTSVNSANHSGEEYAIGIWFTVTTGDKGGSVNIDRTIYKIPSNTTQTIKHETEAGYTTDVIFRGDFIEISPDTMTKSSSSSKFAMAQINHIKNWLLSQEEMYPYQFQYQKMYDTEPNINLPDHITTIDMSAFDSCSFSVNQDINSIFTFSNNIKKVIGNGRSYPLTHFFKNASNEGGVWRINNIVLAPNLTGTSSNYTEATIPNGTRLMASNLFGSLYNNGVQHLFTALATINLPTDNILEEIPDRFCEMCSALTYISPIPASVKRIGEEAFAYNSGSMGLTTMTFNQPAGMYVELPSAGNGTGMLYVKTAREMTIYTDNEYIKNYNYSADNITATILHLDGSAWE